MATATSFMDLQNSTIDANQHGYITTRSRSKEHDSTHQMQVKDSVENQVTVENEQQHKLGFVLGLGLRLVPIVDTDQMYFVFIPNSQCIVLEQTIVFEKSDNNKHTS